MCNFTRPHPGIMCQMALYESAVAQTQCRKWACISVINKTCWTSTQSSQKSTEAGYTQHCDTVSVCRVMWTCVYTRLWESECVIICISVSDAYQRQKMGLCVLCFVCVHLCVHVCVSTRVYGCVAWTWPKSKGNAAITAVLVLQHWYITTIRPASVYIHTHAHIRAEIIFLKHWRH